MTYYVHWYCERDDNGLKCCDSLEAAERFIDETLKRAAGPSGNEFIVIRGEMVLERKT